jgi:hypothetical protein
VFVQILVFLNMTPCLIGGHRRLEEHLQRNPEDGCNMFLRNVDICLQDNMISQPRDQNLKTQGTVC